MAVTEEKRTRYSVWGLDVRKIVYMALGAALYGGLSVVTNFLQLPGAGNVSLRPAIVIPLFFGAVFGPWVGLFTGGVGNLIGDYFSGYGVFWNWDVGNGLIGFIAGLAVITTGGHYNHGRNIIIAEVLAAIAVVVGIGSSAYNEIYLSKIDFSTATITYMVPAAVSDLINGLILLPTLRFALFASTTR